MCTTLSADGCLGWPISWLLGIRESWVDKHAGHRDFRAQSPQGMVHRAQSTGHVPSSGLARAYGSCSFFSGTSRLISRGRTSLHAGRQDALSRHLAGLCSGYWRQSQGRNLRVSQCAFSWWLAGQTFQKYFLPIFYFEFLIILNDFSIEKLLNLNISGNYILFSIFLNQWV